MTQELTRSDAFSRYFFKHATLPGLKAGQANVADPLFLQSRFPAPGALTILRKGAFYGS
ncbi:MAG: hypothetical protein WCG31_10380 [Deltaproteobacteria bacterium]|jgi:hypothetical protein